MTLILSTEIKNQLFQLTAQYPPMQYSLARDIKPRNALSRTDRDNTSYNKQYEVL